MSDDGKKNGNDKIASLVNRAKQKFNTPESDEARESTVDSLELDIDDPTRPQETPRTLTEGRDDLELDADKDASGERENFLGRMTMIQRLILVGVVVAVGFVGYSSMNGAGPDMAYLNQSTPEEPQQSRADAGRQAPGSDSQPESASIQNDGLEPIAQGNVAADTNAIDLTPGSTATESQSAFALDPIEPEQMVDNAAGQGALEPAGSEAMTAPDFGSDSDGLSRGGDSNGLLGESDVSGEGVGASNQAMGEMPFDEAVVSAPTRRGNDFSSLDGRSSGAANEIEDIRDGLQSLSSVVSSLSQSVVSIEKEILTSSQNDEALRNEVRSLMSELKARDRKVRSLIDRPDLSDLVIFRAADNCSTCVPHALFRWDGGDVEVGDGLQWQGFTVAIRGDRLSLIKGDESYHYWYR